MLAAIRWLGFLGCCISMVEAREEEWWWWIFNYFFRFIMSVLNPGLCDVGLLISPISQ